MEKDARINDDYWREPIGDNWLHCGSVQDLPWYDRTIYHQEWPWNWAENTSQLNLEDDKDCAKLKKQFIDAMEWRK